MIPEGYTLETFSQWLTQEIFFEDTEGLGLADLREASPDTYKELYLLGTGFYGNYIGRDGTTINLGTLPSPYVPSVGDDIVLDIRPSPFAFEYGEVITLENGIVLSVRGEEGVLGSTSYSDDQQVQYGDTRLPAEVITVPEGTSIYEGLRLRQFSGAGTERLANPVFEAILGQVLGQMELADISQINLTNMYEFRQRAILETIKTILQNNVAFYPLIDATTGNPIYAGTLAGQLMDLYRVEEATLNSYIAYQRYEAQKGFNVLDEGLSRDTTVKVAW